MQNKIQDIAKLNDLIQTFNADYNDSKLWANRDGFVESATLITFLSANPHLIDLAQDIVNKMNDLGLQP